MAIRMRVHGVEVTIRRYFVGCPDVELRQAIERMKPPMGESTDEPDHDAALARRVQQEIPGSIIFEDTYRGDQTVPGRVY